MKLFAIFGNPVSHSISPLLHNKAIEYFKEEACYGRYLLENGDLLKKKFIFLKLKGVNVTVPHKEAAFKACDEVRGIAKEIEAVNTIINENGKLMGYNTDAPGFYESIKDFKDIKKILILGAGGTAKAISLFLRNKGFDIEILNRSENRLDFFKEKGFKAFSWDSFKISKYDLIINTTSAGLSDNYLPLEENILDSLMKEAKYAVDVIYNKKTPFLKKAIDFNLSYKDGTDMLIYQAVIAFEYFFDKKYKREDILKQMREVIS